MLASGALTFRLVAVPVRVNPLALVNVEAEVTPGKVVPVSCTLTLATPATAVATNESVVAGWNKCDPSGEILLMLCADAVALVKKMQVAASKLVTVELENSLCDRQR